MDNRQRNLLSERMKERWKNKREEMLQNCSKGGLAASSGYKWSEGAKKNHVGSSGYIHTFESKDKISEASKRNWEDSEYRNNQIDKKIGRRWSWPEESRKKFSDKILNTPELHRMYKERALEALKKAPGKQTRPERIVAELLTKLNIPFKYTGISGFTLEGKRPDFCLENNKILEVFGNYWHAPEEEAPRIEFFKDRGYSCLVLWELDINKKLNIVEQKIIKFNEIY